VVIGFGGGSALDLAKAIAALVTNGDVLRYLEVVGEGRSLEARPLPCIAIPTTAGTGSEVTRNAVLASPEHGVKASLRHGWMLPDAAIVDPWLTHELPPEVTASTGVDALTQLIEPYVSTKLNPMTDGFCREGMQRSARSLRRAWSDGKDAKAREDLAMASLLGGLALANAGLGAVHGLAAPIGGLRPVPHGAACAALLPHVMEANVNGLRRLKDSRLDRFAEVAQILTGIDGASPEDGVAWIRQCVRELRIPGLSDWGFQASDIAPTANKALNASSIRANPVTFNAIELETILSSSL
jgi:alcohol dehydrogenase class IV